MFKLATFTSFGLFCLVALLWILQTCVVHQSDRSHLEEKIRNREIAASATSSYLPSNQIRHDVRKDIWFTQDDKSRLHYRIESARSLLTLIPIQNHFEVVETLQGIRCLMQDKLYAEGESPLQQVRLLQAQEGLYRYTTQEFTASGVDLSLFRIAGHDLPSVEIQDKFAFLKGIAKDASFTFSGKTPQFQAGEFKATLLREE
jgi:hypothetical protein